MEDGVVVRSLAITVDGRRTAVYPLRLAPVGDLLRLVMEVIPCPVSGRQFNTSILEDFLVVKDTNGVEVLGDAVVLAVVGVQLDEGFGVVRPLDTGIGDLVDRRQHPVAGIELNIGTVHPENIGQFISLRLGAQFLPVVLISSQIRGDLDIRIFLVERLDILLNGPGLVLVPVGENKFRRGVRGDAGGPTASLLLARRATCDSQSGERRTCDESSSIHDRPSVVVLT